jgi:hypothetical protein
MCLSPYFNGEIPEQRNQYEVLAQSFLNGHIWLDVDVDPQLLTMDNPYDPAARKAAGVTVQWDHAFYNGRYYMYFGVVPVLVVFLPYLLITGTSLTTYHATQLFTALFIVGIFLIGDKISKIFSCAIPLSVKSIFCMAISMMSVCYIVKAPALYCTAIAAGICFMVWGIYLLTLAVWGSGSTLKRRLFFFGGWLCCALVFGCRPPIGMGCVAAFGLMLLYAREKHSEKGFWIDVLICLVPVIVVACGLMAYNYLRFDSLFEFGQSYQLTVADQSNYSVFGVGLKTALSSFFEFFVSPSGMCVFAFPVLSVIFLLDRETRLKIQVSGMRSLVVGLIASILFVAVVDSVWSPCIAARYRCDAYWALGILSYISCGAFMTSRQNDMLVFGRSNFFIVVLSIVTIITSVILFLIPEDASWTNVDARAWVAAKHILTFCIL